MATRPVRILSAVYFVAYYPEDRIIARILSANGVVTFAVLMNLSACAVDLIGARFYIRLKCWVDVGLFYYYFSFSFLGQCV